MNEHSLWTPQEHKIIGSSCSNRSHYDTPYTPQAIIDGLISVEECHKPRTETRTMPEGITSRIYYGLPPVTTIVSLEDLDTDPDSPKYGQTLRDPIVVWYDRKDASTFTETEFDKLEFPFQRNEPVVRLENE